MNLLNMLPATLTRTVSRGMLIVSKHSPEILMGAGIVSGIAATVFACKATLKLDQVKCDTQTTFRRIAEGKANNPDTIYSQEDMKRDMTVAYFQGAFAIARLYAPAIGLGVLSIGLLTRSHGILNKRNATLAAAYEALSATFDQYRQKMVEDHGIDPVVVVDVPDGEETVIEATGDDKGNETIQVKKVAKTRKGALSQYAAVFDEHSRAWRGDRVHNLYTLKCQEQYLNDKLKAHGHVFLNEAFDALGMDRTQAGCIVGWVYDEHIGKDNFISIGWNDPRNQDAVNIDNPNPPIVLDFNVDGQIWELLS